jgi:hypothetical protein
MTFKFFLRLNLSRTKNANSSTCISAQASGPNRVALGKDSQPFLSAASAEEFFAVDHAVQNQGLGADGATSMAQADRSSTT